MEAPAGPEPMELDATPAAAAAADATAAVPPAVGQKFDSAIMYHLIDQIIMFLNFYTSNLLVGLIASNP